MMDIHPGLMIWTIISFVLLLILLSKFAWKPILAALEAREQGIADNIAAAKEAREEADKSLEEYRKQLAEAQAEAQSVINKARQDAERVREDLLEKSRKEAEILVERAHKQIEADGQAAINQIRNEIASLAIIAAEKVISRELNETDHLRLINEVIEENPN